jgi:hypothetical protein
MDDKIVTLDTFYDPMLAEIIRTRLEANGISCFIADNNTIGANPFFNQALGGVKIKVFEHDVDRCKAILAQSEELALSDELPEQTDVTCPYCLSSNVRYGAATQVKTNWIVALISYLLVAFPFLYANKAWHCFNCQRDFE